MRHLGDSLFSSGLGSLGVLLDLVGHSSQQSIQKLDVIPEVETTVLMQWSVGIYKGGGSFSTTCSVS